MKKEKDGGKGFKGQSMAQWRRTGIRQMMGKIGRTLRITGQSQSQSSSKDTNPREQLGPGRKEEVANNRPTLHKVPFGKAEPIKVDWDR